jgi:hypothetical protein
MDYFSELLSSYDQLKKRTFKLRFISEQEKAAAPKPQEDKPLNAQQLHQGAATALTTIQAAVGKIKNLGQANGVTITSPAGARVELWLAKGTASKSAAGAGQAIADTVVKAKSGTHFGAVLDAGAKGAFTWSPQLVNQTKKYNEFVKKFIGTGAEDGSSESVENTANASNQAELDAQAAREAELAEQRKKVGGFLEQEGLLEGVGPHRVVYELAQVKGNIEKYCRDNESSTDRKLKNMCSNANSYVAAGEGGKGLEYKLGTLEVKSVDASGVLQPSTPTASVRLDLARSANFLTSWMTDLDPERCADVTKKIGVFGKSLDKEGDFDAGSGKLVLFGSTPEDAVVLGKPNAPQRLALKNIKKTCPEQYDNLSKVVNNTVDGKAKNAVKGTFFEALLVFQTKAFAAQNLKGKAKKDALEAAIQDLQKVIKDNYRILKQVVEDWENNPNRGQSIDAAFDMSVQMKLLDNLTGDAATLKESLMKELRAAQPFISFMNADDISHGGTVSKTGQRADINFIYNDETVAREKAEAIGSSVQELMDDKGKPTGKYAVPVGLKRIKKLKGPKFGEINSRERMLALITDAPGLENDRNIEKGFQESMRKKIFGTTKKNTDREKRMVDYALQLEQDLEETTEQLVSGNTFIDDEGMIKSQTPGGILNKLAEQLLTILNLKDAKNSLLSSAFFYEEGNKLTIKPFDGESDESVDYRRRSQELVMRTARFNRLKNDANGVPRSDDDTREEIEQRQQAARDYMIKSALVCGSNTQNMTQLVVTDKGEALPVKHNAAFDAICAANNTKPPTVEFDFEGRESSVQITGEGLSVSLKQEHTSSGEGDNKKSDTRSDVSMTKATLEKIVAVLPTSENSSTLLQYLEGQMRLLETLITQAK